MIAPKKKEKKKVRLIKKSNNLIQAKYWFNIWELRLFLTILSKVNESREGNETYQIWYKEVIDIFNIKSRDSYRSLREAAQSLIRKPIRVNSREGGLDLEEEIVLFLNIKYLSKKNPVNRSSEYIEVRINGEMRPFLMELKKNFTVYDLSNVTQLNPYPLRVYELLKQYQSIGTRILQIENMKEMFELRAEYQNYSNFYKQVIAPSEREINEHTDLMIESIDPIKEGLRVVAVQIKFRAKTKAELVKIRSSMEQEGIDIPCYIDMKDTNEGLKQPIYMLQDRAKKEIAKEETAEKKAQGELMLELWSVVIGRYEVHYETFKDLIETHTEDSIKRAVRLTEEGLNAGKIKKPAGFFVSAVKNNYQKAVTAAIRVPQKEEKEKKYKYEDKKSFERETLKDKFDKKRKIFKNLLETDECFRQDLTNAINTDNRIIHYYDKQKDILSNMENSLIASRLITLSSELRSDIFEMTYSD